MILRRASIALIAAAAVLYLAVAVPRQQAAAEAAAQHREARRALHAAQARATEARQKRERGERILAALKRAATQTSLSGVRKQTLELIRDLPLQGVRLDVAARAPHSHMSISLHAEGAFLDLVALAARFGPDHGFVLNEVRIATGQDGVPAIDLTATYPGEQG